MTYLCHAVFLVFKDLIFLTRKKLFKNINKLLKVITSEYFFLNTALIPLFNNFSICFKNNLIQFPYFWLLVVEFMFLFLETLRAPPSLNFSGAASDRVS
jgi:hypothetical protein